MADSTPPSPTTAMVWFFIITSIFFVIKYNVRDAVQSKIYLGIYIALLVIGEYIINLSLTDTMCGSRQWNTALLVTLIPWVVIFGILNVVLMMFPGWLAPFSNTFGYAIARLSGVGKFMDDILKPNIKMTGKNVDIAAEALEHIYSDKSLLINEITQSNFERFWTNMSSLFKPEVVGDIAKKNQLLDYIRLKDIVAEYIWYMLTGGLVTSVGYNYVVNTGCSQSVKDMKKRHKEYEENAKKNYTDKQGATPRVYTMIE